MDDVRWTCLGHVWAKTNTAVTGFKLIREITHIPRLHWLLIYASGQCYLSEWHRAEKSTTLQSQKPCRRGRAPRAQDCCCNGCQLSWFPTSILCLCTSTTLTTRGTVLDCPSTFPAFWPNVLLAETFTPCRAKDKITKTHSVVICCLGDLRYFSAREQLSTLGWNATVNLPVLLPNYIQQNITVIWLEESRNWIRSYFEVWLLLTVSFCPAPSPRLYPSGMILCCRHTTWYGSCPEEYMGQTELTIARLLLRFYVLFIRHWRERMRNLWRLFILFPLFIHSSPSTDCPGNCS